MAFKAVLVLLLVSGCIEGASRENNGSTNNATNNGSTNNGLTNNATNNGSTNNETNGFVPPSDWTNTIATLRPEGANFELTNGEVVFSGSTEQRSDCQTNDSCGLLNPGAQAKLETPLGGGTTMGGWFWLDDKAGDYALLRRSYSGSVAELKYEDGRFKCIWTNADNSPPPVQTPSDFDSKTWYHVVCTAQNNFRRITLNGQELPADDVDYEDVMLQADEVLLGGGNARAFGVDDVFITDKLLSTETNARIFSCGVDGSACRCDPDDPEMYADFGRRAGQILPDCDADPY